MKISAKKILAATLMIVCGYAISSSQMLEDISLEVIKNYLPGTSNIGKLSVLKVNPDSSTKTIDIDINETGAYIPLTSAKLEELKKDVKSALGKKYKDYDIRLYSVRFNDKGEERWRKSFDELVLFAPKNYVTPSEKNQFITRLDAPQFPRGLDGSNIAMWQSHGWYFEPKLNRWEWQRARIFQTVEDLYTQSYVIPFLMPMLENAGAYVISPRERDVNINEVIIDNDGGFAKGKFYHDGWTATSLPGFGYTDSVLTVGVNPFEKGTALMTKATAQGAKAKKSTWSAEIPEAGNYAVYVSYQTLPNSVTDALYTVNALDGKHNFKVNQQMGGGTWIYLGHFPFAAGAQKEAIVEL